MFVSKNALEFARPSFRFCFSIAVAAYAIAPGAVSTRPLSPAALAAVSIPSQSPADPSGAEGRAVPPVGVTPPPPSTASELHAALQSRLANFLTRLLESGVTPDVPLTPLPALPRVNGPDAELLQLQGDSLALAIEALNLRTKPGTTGPAGGNQ